MTFAQVYAEYQRTYTRRYIDGPYPFIAAMHAYRAACKVPR
jgi:hypothetical protein